MDFCERLISYSSDAQDGNRSGNNAEKNTLSPFWIDPEKTKLVFFPPHKMFMSGLVTTPNVSSQESVGK